MSSGICENQCFLVKNGLHWELQQYTRGHEMPCLSTNKLSHPRARVPIRGPVWTPWGQWTGWALPLWLGVTQLSGACWLRPEYEGWCELKPGGRRPEYSARPPHFLRQGPSAQRDPSNTWHPMQVFSLFPGQNCMPLWKKTGNCS